MWGWSVQGRKPFGNLPVSVRVVARLRHNRLHRPKILSAGSSNSMMVGSERFPSMRGLLNKAISGVLAMGCADLFSIRSAHKTGCG